ncbi:class I SAM-dependent methyltransferase [Pyruvatibacter sp.]
MAIYMYIYDYLISIVWGLHRQYGNMEIVYKQLFERELESIGLNDEFYPLNGAANYSLLFLVLRVIRKYKRLRVLELGCGQTTLLMSRLIEKGFELEVDSLENSSAWAERTRAIASKVNVIYSQLEVRKIRGLSFQGYSLDALDLGKYDLIVVDGPAGSKGISRASAIELASSHLEKDFIMIVDDAERFGERRMLRQLLKLLEGRGQTFHRSTTRAMKWQVVIASDAYEEAIYL